MLFHKQSKLLFCLLFRDINWSCYPSVAFLKSVSINLQLSNDFRLFDKSRNAINVLKSWKLVARQKVSDKQGRPRSDCFWRSSLIRVFPVCYSDKHFFEFQPWKPTLIFVQKQKENSIWNFRLYRYHADRFTWLLHTCMLSLFVCFVALRPKSTAMVMAGQPVHLTTLFPGQAWTSS